MQAMLCEASRDRAPFLGIYCKRAGAYLQPPLSDWWSVMLGLNQVYCSFSTAVWGNDLYIQVLGKLGPGQLGPGAQFVEPYIHDVRRSEEYEWMVFLWKYSSEETRFCRLQIWGMTLMGDGWSSFLCAVQLASPTPPPPPPWQESN